eukprot:Nitzschia sp. Nitz4//scaffold247_size31676//5310//8505//NITZ4_007926-RA/size31676-augustus-gene-0.29-mRNA-1//-1//CDS//3329543943//5851//frame0
MSCSVQLSFEDGQPESLFEASELLFTLKDVIPRFGQTDDLSTAWIEGGDSSSYLIGLFASCMIVTAVLVAWVIALIGCSRAGPLKCGIWSGRVPEPKEPPNAPEILFPQNQVANYRTSSTNQSFAPVDASVTSNDGPMALSSGQPTKAATTTAINNNTSISPSNTQPKGNNVLLSLLPNTSYDQSPDSSYFLSVVSQSVDQEPILPPTPPRDLFPHIIRATVPPNGEIGIGTTTVHLDMSELPTTEESVDLLDDAQGDVQPASPTASVHSAVSSSSKYSEYMKYLDEAANTHLLKNKGGGNTDDDDSDDDSEDPLASPMSKKDSDDWLLDSVLADDLPEPTNVPASPAAASVTSASSEDSTNMEADSALLDETTDDIGEVSQQVEDQQQQQQDLNMSFPFEAPEEGFLFEDDDGEESSGVYDGEQPMHGSTLPQSNFTSRAAARKRLLESCAKNFRNTSSLLMTSNVLVTDDSQLVINEADSIVIRPSDLAGDSDSALSSLPLSSTKILGSNATKKTNGKLDPLQMVMPSNTDSTEQSGSSDGDDDHDEEVESIVNVASVVSRLSESSRPRPPQSSSKTLTREYTAEEQAELEAYRKEHNDWVQDQRRLQRNLHTFRALVVVAGTVLIVSTLLCALNGMWNLDWQRQNMLEAWNVIRSNALQLESLATYLVTLQLNVRQQLWTVWQLLDQHCPLVRDNICSVEISSSSSAFNSTCNVDGIPLESQWQAWLDVYVDPQTIESEYLEVQDWWSVALDADTFSDQPVDNYLSGWNWALWAAVTCNAVLAVAVFTILAAVALPEANTLHRQISTWSFSIIYWTAALFTWCFGICLMVATTLTVDSCMVEDGEGSPSPTTVAKTLLQRMDTESSIPQYWDYIVDGCPADDYPSLLDDRVTAWAGLLPTAIRLQKGFSAYNNETFLDQCGVSIDALREATGTLSEQLCTVTQELSTMRSALGCDKWYPWYESISNNSLCDNGTNALAWACGTQLLVLIMVFIIWTLRASFIIPSSDASTEAMSRSGTSQQYSKGGNVSRGSMA